MIDHEAVATRLVDGLDGDRITREGTPVVAAQLLEAQVHATLAVATALQGILVHLEDRAITVRSE